MKLTTAGTALAAVMAIVSCTPALAQHHALHPKATPAICIFEDASATAVWVSDPNHFHPVLDLHTSLGDSISSGIHPDIPAPPEFDEAIAGAYVHDLSGFKIGNFAFDYKTDYCNGESGDIHFFFVSVTNAQNNTLFFSKCDDFPVTGSVNTWHHEKFTSSIMDFAQGDDFGTIFIGIVNGEEPAGTAQVKNITVNGVITDNVFRSAVTFCPQINGDE
jgi:hypothetical protein